MWKKVVFALVTIPPSLALLAAGLLLLWVANIPVCPDWLSFLEGARRVAVEGVGMLATAAGLVLSAYSVGSFVYGLYLWAHQES